MSVSSIKSFHLTIVGRLLVMANRGPGTKSVIRTRKRIHLNILHSSSQFFLTLAPAQHLNGKHVVFGRVVSGISPA